MEDRFIFRGMNKGKWYYGGYFKHLPYTPQPIRDSEVPEKDYKHLIVRDGFSDWGLPRNMACIEVEAETVGQCTGLKDKNGYLIYEGDIISDKLNHVRVCVWEYDGFKYPALKTSRYFHAPISNKLEERKNDLRKKLTFQDNVCKCDKKEFIVIGNIYENEDLLNEASDSD